MTNIATCPCCSKMVPHWKIKAGGGLLADAKRIITEAAQGNQNILYKRKGDVDIYFRPAQEGSTDGLLVRVRSGEQILSVDEASEDSFK